LDQIVIKAHQERLSISIDNQLNYVDL
jgi:hypothetical protein